MPFSNLPDDANKVWEKIYNYSKAHGNSEEMAAKKAWSGIQAAGWHKVGDKWVKRSNALTEFSMTFTSLPFDKHNGEMRFRAVASDTGKDTYDERMSNELYRSFISKIKAKEHIPEAFKSLVESSYFKGQPYLSVSHYPDLDGAGVPGIPEELYIDGNQFKAKGKFYDTALGRACYKALLKDKETKNTENPVRVSIAFLDLVHKHGVDGQPFSRKSLDDVCPQCSEGVGDKIYTDGYLVHLALTRVPVNKRADIEVDKSMADETRITREEDAASIIDPELAHQLEEKAAMIGRSEALVEMSKTKAVNGVNHSSSDFLVVGDPDKVGTWHLPVKKNGKPDHGLMRAARAALTSPGGHRGQKYGGPGGSGAIGKLKRLYSSEKMEWDDGKKEKSMAGTENDPEVELAKLDASIEASAESTEVEKSETKPEVEKAANVMDLPNQMKDDDITYMPYGGTKALEQITHVWDRQGAKDSLESVFALLEETMQTIFARDVGNKKTAIHGVAEELKNVVQLKPESGIDKSVLATPVKALVDKVQAVKSMADATYEQKAETIQPLLNDLAEAIKGELQNKPIVEGDEMAGPEETTIKKWIAEAIATALVNQQKSEAITSAKLDQILAMQQNRSQVSIPRPRSLAPSLNQRDNLTPPSVLAARGILQQGYTPTKPVDPMKPKSVRDIVHRNMGA